MPLVVDQVSGSVVGAAKVIVDIDSVDSMQIIIIGVSRSHFL
jgi:hypothetical protein